MYPGPQPTAQIGLGARRPGNDLNQAGIGVGNGLNVNRPPPPAPRQEVRFAPLANGNGRCGRCFEEVPAAGFVAHAATHNPPPDPQVINMREVDPAAAPDRPQGDGDVAGNGHPGNAEVAAGEGAGVPPAPEVPP